MKPKSKPKDDAAEMLDKAVGASIGNALADALNGIKNIPAPKTRLPAPVKFEGAESILIVYEMMPEEVHLYFIPCPEQLPKNLLGAIKAMENVTVNCTTLTDKQNKAFQYINAAMCVEPRNLDESNPNNCNRFAHMLVPFLVENTQKSAPCFPIMGGRALRIIRSGFAM